jgi:hypothetical protein
LLLHDLDDVITYRLAQEVGRCLATSNGTPFLPTTSALESLAKRDTVRQNKKSVRVSLPAKLYDRLYAARNTFMHGNSIVGRPLRWTRGKEHLPLISCAPCLFAATLRAALTGLGAVTVEDNEWWSGMHNIGCALLPKEWTRKDWLLGLDSNQQPSG